MADLLVERGWIVPADKAHVDYLLERKLHKHGGDPRASLAAIPDDVKRSLAALGDDDIQRSLAGVARAGGGRTPGATVDHVPGPRRALSPDSACTRPAASAASGWPTTTTSAATSPSRSCGPSVPSTPRSGRAFSRRRRSPASSNTPASFRFTSWSGAGDGRQPFYTMRFVKGRTLSEAARAYHDKRLAGQADALDLPVAAECLRHGLQHRGLRALARGHPPRPQGPERDPGRFRRGRRARLGPGQAGRPARGEAPARRRSSSTTPAPTAATRCRARRWARRRTWRRSSPTADST